MITDADKLKCAQRELMRRKRIYTNRVYTKRMTLREADLELAAMAAIVHDYVRLCEANVERLADKEHLPMVTVRHREDGSGSILERRKKGISHA